MYLPGWSTGWTGGALPVEVQCYMDVCLSLWIRAQNRAAVHGVARRNDTALIDSATPCGGEVLHACRKMSRTKRPT